MLNHPASRLLWAGTIALALGTGPAVAQTEKRNPGPPAIPVTVEFADEPHRIESVGLTVLLPVGSTAQSQRVGPHTKVRVAPAPPDETWLVNIDTPLSRDGNLTAAQVAEGVLKQVLESVGVSLRKPDPGKGIETKSVETAGQVLERRDTVQVPGCPAPGSRFYVRLPRGPEEAPVVRGYTVFPAGSGRFVTFELLTTEPEFPRTRQIYESTVATARLEDAGALAASRGAAIEAGTALLGGTTPEDLRAIIADRGEAWYRIYKEAPTKADGDATEIGYQRVRFWSGHRGEIDPSRERSRWSAADRQDGFLVRIEGRSVLDGQIIDSRGAYFMTPDRTEEVWTIQMAIRDVPSGPGARRSPVQTWTETGARSARGMSVTVSGVGRSSEAARPVVPDQGYINQVESLLLPQLLVRRGQPGEYGFYLYQSEFGNVRLRRDVLEAVPDAPGVWRITTRLTEDKEPRVSLYKSTGDLISTRMADGTIVEPATRPRLLDLWRSKGLPLD
jgi:hypothetical protein